MKQIVITIVLLIAVFSAEAQTTMSLRQCMEYAIEHSSKMQIQATEIKEARITRRQAILNSFTPEISAGTNANYNFGRAVDPETNTYNSITSFNNAYSVSGYLRLFNGFSAINNMKISKTTLKMGLSREVQLREEICLATMEAYFNVVYAQKLVEVYEGIVQTAEKNLDLAQRQMELGQKGYADVIQFEAELEDRKFEQTTALNQRDDALLVLKDLMLYPVEEPLSVDTSIVQSAMACDVCYSYDEVVGQALETLPSISLAQGKQLNAKRELSTARWSSLPSISFSGGWSTSYFSYQGQRAESFANQFKTHSGEYVQLNLSIPLFRGLFQRSKISKAKQAYKRATLELDQTKHEVETEVARALQDQRGAFAAMTQAQKRAKVQEEAYRLNSSKLNNGLISSLEYQTAANQYLKAKAEQVDAILKYHLKRSVVNYYRGISYVDQN